jgi:hypothetical protein
MFLEIKSLVTDIIMIEHGWWERKGMYPITSKKKLL